MSVVDRPSLGPGVPQCMESRPVTKTTKFAGRSVRPTYPSLIGKATRCRLWLKGPGCCTNWHVPQYVKLRSVAAKARRVLRKTELGLSMQRYGGDGERCRLQHEGTTCSACKETAGGGWAGVRFSLRDTTSRTTSFSLSSPERGCEFLFPARDNALPCHMRSRPLEWSNTSAAWPSGTPTS